MENEKRAFLIQIHQVTLNEENLKLQFHEIIRRQLSRGNVVCRHTWCEICTTESRIQDSKAAHVQSPTKQLNDYAN